MTNTAMVVLVCRLNPQKESSNLVLLAGDFPKKQGLAANVSCSSIFLCEGLMWWRWQRALLCRRGHDVLSSGMETNHIQKY